MPGRRSVELDINKLARIARQQAKLNREIIMSAQINSDLLRVLIDWIVQETNSEDHLADIFELIAVNKSVHRNVRQRAETMAEEVRKLTKIKKQRNSPVVDA